MRLALVMQRRLEERLRIGVGISLAQFRALTQINDTPEISGAALSRLLLITPQSASSLVSGLTREALVQRASVATGVVMGLTLTAKGVEKLKQAIHVVEIMHAEENLFVSLQEAEAADKTLRKILAGLVGEAPNGRT